MVEKERIRPSYAHTPANLVKGVFHVPPGLEKDMLLTSDHLPKLAKLVGQRYEMDGAKKLQADLFALHLAPNGKSLIGLVTRFFFLCHSTSGIRQTGILQSCGNCRVRHQLALQKGAATCRGSAPPSQQALHSTVILADQFQSFGSAKEARHH